MSKMPFPAFLRLTIGLRIEEEAIRYFNSIIYTCLLTCGLFWFPEIPPWISDTPGNVTVPYFSDNSNLSSVPPIPPVPQ